MINLPAIDDDGMSGRRRMHLAEITDAELARAKKRWEAERAGRAIPSSVRFDYLSERISVEFTSGEGRGASWAAGHKRVQLSSSGDRSPVSFQV